MAAATCIPIERYRTTSYRPDREYIDGELLERNAGKYNHARLETLLAFWAGTNEKSWSVKGLTEQRLQISATRVRIPDFMLVPRGPHPDVIVAAPILVVEVLSPDDTYADTERRAADYLSIGSPVWIIDPETRTGRQCVGSSWTAADRLEVPGTPIRIDLPKLFADLDED